MTAIVATPDAFVRVRVGSDIKQRAGAALEAMGLSISEAVRLLLVRVANEGRLPFDLAAPWAAKRSNKVSGIPMTGAQFAEALHSIGRELELTNEDIDLMERAIEETNVPIEPMVFEE